MAENPSAPLARITSLPSWLLGRAAARGHRLVAEAFAGEGMRMPHHVLLTAVDSLGPVAQAELARSVRIDPKDVVTVLNDLQKEGLVTRTPDPKDRRKNAIAISPAGKRRLRRLEELGGQANDALLAPLDAAEREQLVALLSRIVDPAERCGPSGAPESSSSGGTSRR